jgi:hypothetical protein
MRVFVKFGEAAIREAQNATSGVGRIPRLKRATFKIAPESSDDDTTETDEAIAKKKKKEDKASKAAVGYF